MSNSKPKIAVVPNRKDRVSDDYLARLRTAGADPVVLPLSEYREPVARVLRRCRGLLLTGGGDFTENWYENFTPEKRKMLRDLDEIRERSEFCALDLAREMNKPVFGICRGFQAINLHAGGTLIADIALELAGKEIPEHRASAAPKDSRPPDHDVFFDPETRLGRLAAFSAVAVREKDRVRLRVNNSHHQALGKVGKGLRAAAWAADGVVEALESEPSAKVFWFGVQFHPERMENDFARRLFELFVKSV